MSLIVEELFDYTAQKLDGLNGGTGWSGAWSTSAAGTGNPAVQANNLSVTGVSNGAPSNNSKLYARNAAYATSTKTTFTRSHTGIPNSVNGAVYWMAFNIASNVAKGGATFVLDHLTSDNGGANPQVILQWTNALADAIVACNGTTLYTGSTSYVAHNVVLKITMSGTGATPVRVDVYCDVDMTTNPAGWTPLVTSTSWYVTADITSFTFDAQTAATTSGDAQLYMDNIRWATTSYEAGGNAVPSAYNSRFFQLF